MVLGFWSGHWDFEVGESHRTQLLSDPCVNFVFELGGSEAGSRLVGVWTKLWERTLSGRGLARGVKLRPGALRAFVDRSASAFTNRSAQLSEAFSGDLSALGQRVLSVDAEHAFDELRNWLTPMRRESERDRVSLAVAVVDRVANDASITSVDGLASASGVSTRPLQRLFREYVGASPKWVIRRFRLQEVATRIDAGEVDNLAGLAAELGYADQAHLARDFRSAVGKSPSMLRKHRRG